MHASFSRRVTFDWNEQTLERNQEVARTAGVPYGKFHKDPGDLPGASRGACVFRLVPSFVFHEGKRAQHPIMRPPASEVLLFPCIQNPKP